MIGSLRGQVLRLDLSSVLIETSSGLGYEVFITFPTHLHLKSKARKKDVLLYIFHSITDRNQKLFGFINPRDRELFQLMKSLNGIGELTALKILSFYNADSLFTIATDENKAALEKIPKVKGKTSEKVLFELKQNLKKLESFLQKDTSESKDENNSDSSTVTLEKDISPRLENNAKDLAILGLIQLGFDEKNSRKEVERLWNSGTKEASEIIRLVLQNL
ncbi:MAG: Holliday junction branch migration protein RuvA [Leptospira sp.]|nr:Holliday junction branch migration protein RuvA [Leptospira sp.]NCS94590.1 Holliday junction branch migration protein RuvA [Leptospira sp.]